MPKFVKTLQISSKVEVPFLTPPQWMTLICSHMNGGIWLEFLDAHLHPLPIAFWCKCVLHHYVGRIGIWTRFFIRKCDSNWCLIRWKTWCTYTLITSFAKMTWHQPDKIIWEEYVVLKLNVQCWKNVEESKSLSGDQHDL
jgi:hypothetical protein